MGLEQARQKNKTVPISCNQEYLPPKRSGDGGTLAKSTFLFQLAYGLDYISVEVFFRGFLVIGMVRWLGRGAILPMTVVYCFLHFGKPMGEAISSIFGGYLLGVIAYYSKSIWGGAIVHMGLAWMMEVAAYVQLYLLGRGG